MIPVEVALERVLELCEPLATEMIDLREAAGRVLAEPATARRAQPPFAASAMDGYAIRDADHRPGCKLKVIGTSAAGRGYSGAVSLGEAVRIFTGAPVPEGAERVVLQEDVERDGDTITLGNSLEEARHVRPAGQDFEDGFRFHPRRRLSPADLALIAAMNVPRVTVHHRADVAILSTGDELVMPGETPGPDQIIASNGFALAAIAEEEGATARILPIARDDEESLRYALDLARDADLIVTIGGASVGDHDLVAKVAGSAGAEQSFHKVAMRPGKPLMAGRLGRSIMLGLPGNPVSSIVCGHIFLRPMLRALHGLPKAPLPTRRGRLGTDVAANGPRTHFMRARLSDADGQTVVTPFDRQGSALLTVMADADALLIRPAQDGPRERGEEVRFIPLKTLE
ncbi:molybdopterin molybdotransferase [Albidovulum inexpectatum]|uniref:Molybdopterin molybdenumtransferase n=1 Tax=Albidovulum inexpectatum TaxID=196587 RepID=A0A2S5JJW9_9RHOB|nr:gephyrin-like molybdotransferase Glp [Albidovulum inexpectatum]PPB81691.1 molybdopterin molybdotransferase [Albidovulum inexpectatum]